MNRPEDRFPGYNPNTRLSHYENQQRRRTSLAFLVIMLLPILALIGMVAWNMITK